MKIATGILLAATLLTLTACSSTPSTATTSTPSATTTDASTTNENQAENSNASDTEETKQEEVVEQKQEETVTPLKKGETVTIEKFADITVSGSKIAKKIEPSNPGTFYTYYESKEADSTYFALTIKAKNLNTEGIGADEIAEVNLKFDNQYDYRTFSTIEKGGGEDFTYTNITTIDPLKSGTLLYIVEIPNEVAKSDKPLKAEIKIQDQLFEYTVR